MMVMVAVVAVVVVGEEGGVSATEITRVKAAAVKREITVVKPEAAEATIETVVKPEVAKPEATESTLLEVAEAAIANHESITLVKAAPELTASSAPETTAPVCHLC